MNKKHTQQLMTLRIAAYWKSLHQVQHLQAKSNSFQSTAPNTPITMRSTAVLQGKVQSSVQCICNGVIGHTHTQKDEATQDWSKKKKDHCTLQSLMKQSKMTVDWHMCVWTFKCNGCCHLLLSRAQWERHSSIFRRAKIPNVFIPKGFITKSCYSKVFKSQKGHYSKDFYPEGSLFRRFLSRRVVFWISE